MDKDISVRRRRRSGGGGGGGVCVDKCDHGEAATLESHNWPRVLNYHWLTSLTYITPFTAERSLTEKRDYHWLFPSFFTAAEATEKKKKTLHAGGPQGQTDKGTRLLCSKWEAPRLTAISDKKRPHSTLHAENGSGAASLLPRPAVKTAEGRSRCEEVDNFNATVLWFKLWGSALGGPPRSACAHRDVWSCPRSVITPTNRSVF